MNSEKSVANNTSWFSIALIIQKIITFGYFAYVARIIGVESLGQYVFVLSFITIFALLIDIGTNHYLTREVARDNQSGQNLFSNIVGFKIFSSLIAVLVGLGLAILLHYEMYIMQLLYIAFAIMIVESLVLSIYAVIRGFQNLRFEAITTVLVHSFILLTGWLVLQQTKNVKYLLLVLLGAHSLNALIGLIILKTKFNIGLHLKFNFGFWKKILPIVLPFALAAGFAKIYGAFDQIMLSKMSSELELGHYAVAYKLTFALQFIPMALIAPLYPALSKLNANKDRLQFLFNKAFIYLLIVSLPIVALVSVFAQDIILLFYSVEYYASIIILQLFILSLPFLFLNFPIGSLLNATDQQKQQTINMGLALGLNIILNIIFIPIYEARGAAIGSSISTVFLFTLGLASVAKINSFNLRSLQRPIVITILTILFMTLLMRWAVVYTDLNWFIIGIIGFIVYVVILILTKIINIKELRDYIK